MMLMNKYASLCVFNLGCVFSCLLSGRSPSSDVLLLHFLHPCWVALPFVLLVSRWHSAWPAAAVGSNLKVESVNHGDIDNMASLLKARQGALCI